MYPKSLTFSLFLSSGFAQDDKLKDWVPASIEIHENHMYQQLCLAFKERLDAKALENVPETAKQSEFWQQQIEHAITNLLVVRSADQNDQEIDTCLEHIALHEQEVNYSNNTLRTTNCPGGNCNVLFDLSGLMNYGCWCNLGAEQLGTGSGRPVNVFDQVCQKFQQCLKCVNHDSNTGGYNCDVNNDSFEVASGPDFVADCRINNPDECAANQCCCHSDFIANLIDLIWQNTVYDPQFLHSRGFDKSQCDMGGGAGIKDCCGKYPNRFPFNAERRDCCDKSGKIFIRDIEVCCPNGEIALAGTCA